MKLLKILALLAALALSGCNNNKNNHLNKATSLDVNNSHIELEFSNIKYKKIDKVCFKEKIEQFNKMYKTKNYVQHKHVTFWGTHNFFEQSGKYKNTVIHLRIDKKKSTLIILNNVVPEDKKYLKWYKEHRYKPLFEILPRQLEDMAKESFYQSWSKEDIDFESCFIK
jgi:uncharacterized protein YcfL